MGSAWSLMWNWVPKPVSPATTVSSWMNAAPPGIRALFAAGDCTNHPNKLLDRPLRLESGPNAMEQSRVAASNLTGGDKKYASIPWFWSDQYDLKLQMVGFSSDADESITRGDRKPMSSLCFTTRAAKSSRQKPSIHHANFWWQNNSWEKIYRPEHAVKSRG
ncbi:MAG: hypothetical protein Ct9H300mP8_00060 [Gammaproteobacteria bacterium]|nr:MAG: hypothetical protein Ct9H300mP8_00060 [Gammaproteobacteria bacterium]